MKDLKSLVIEFGMTEGFVGIATLTVFGVDEAGNKEEINKFYGENARIVHDLLFYNLVSEDTRKLVEQGLSTEAGFYGLNAHGEYVMKFANNHGLSLSEAHDHPTVKAHLAAYNGMKDVMKPGFIFDGIHNSERGINVGQVDIDKLATEVSKKIAQQSQRALRSATY